MYLTMTGWLGWFKCCPVHQKAVGLIPSQGTDIGCGSITGWGVYRRQLIDLSLSH